MTDSDGDGDGAVSVSEGLGSLCDADRVGPLSEVDSDPDTVSEADSDALSETVADTDADSDALPVADALSVALADSDVVKVPVDDADGVADSEGPDSESDGSESVSDSVIEALNVFVCVGGGVTVALTDGDSVSLLVTLLLRVADAVSVGVRVGGGVIVVDDVPVAVGAGETVSVDRVAVGVVKPDSEPHVKLAVSCGMPHISGIPAGHVTAEQSQAHRPPPRSTVVTPATRLLQM